MFLKRERDEEKKGFTFLSLVSWIKYEGSLDIGEAKGLQVQKGSQTY